MSILAEVLESAATVNIDDINKKVPELKATVESYKNEVITNVENVYVKYKNRSLTNDLLLNKALQAEQTLSSLKEKAEFIINKDLAKTDLQLNKKISELHSIQFALEVVLNLQNCVKLLDDFNTELSVHNYLKCVEIIEELNKKIQSIPVDEHLEVTDELKLVIKEKKIRLQNELKNIFTDNIQVIDHPEIQNELADISIEEQSEQETESTINSNRDKIKHKTTLKIKKLNDDIENAMLALYSDSKGVYPLNSLARDLWNLIFVPVVDKEVELEETEDKTYVMLHLSVKNTEKKSDYQTVFKNLKEVLQFLLKNFTYNISDDLPALKYIGDDIRDNLSELIIKNCLRDTIPSDAEELQNFKVVIEQTKDLESVLLEAKIFTPETTSILEYASNVDVLFINKKCEEYLNTATEIMKKDLHDMVEVGVPYNPDYPLGKEVLEFSQCCISKNVQELLHFCENLLQKALGASPENSGRLFTTVTNIWLKYRTFVPEYHKNYLASLPQQIGLFFNNCRYIAHVLMEWNMKYCELLKPTLVACNFTVESNQFPLVALDMFNEYIEGQINQINEIMSGSQLQGPTLDKIDPKTERCVRQCLRQQELLRTVWHKVLPYDFYNQNIGTIVDAFCRNIIDAVVKFEDISATSARQLADIIKMVLTRAPKLFINPNEITLYVPLWYKLNELNFVLNASLIDINDRWADGKGPLALQFAGSELKQLIKALFQNTDRRAAVLAKISDFKPKNN